MAPRRGSPLSDQLDQSEDDQQTPTSDMEPDDLYPGAPEDSDDDDDEFDLEDNEDGSVNVRTKSKSDKTDTGEDGHYSENLAEKLEDYERKSLARKLLELTEHDKKAAEERDKKYQDGLQRTGATVEAPGGAQFSGASRATHPMLLECSIDFSSSVFKEMFPADGPCKIKTYGNNADAKELERAARIRDHMNWQLTEEIEEYEEVLDETLSQVPLAGSQYTKWWWDRNLGRPRIEYIPSEDLLLSAAESSFWNARRKTHRQMLVKEIVDERMRSGQYIDIDLVSAPITPERTKAEAANDKIEGIDPDGYNDDGARLIYDYYIFWKFEQFGDEFPKPYIITVDDSSTEVLAINRNWEEDDDRFCPMDWIVEWPFIKWRGPYTIGFTHVIGGLSAAATGALRALLDSAHINNTAAGVKLKGARFGGQSQQVDVTGITEVEAGPNVDDIRKLFMPMPFNPPSPMLFQLLGFLVDAAKGIVRAAEETADNNPNAPVGTTLANIEQGAKVFSAIHKRLHKAQKKSLRIQYRLNRLYLTEERVIDEVGQLTVRPEDYAAPSPIVPVSDPNIFSESQRYAQLQGVMQLDKMYPGKYNQDEINKRMLGLMRIPDPQGLLVTNPDPKEQNPVAENLALAFGGKAMAFPMQDHFAHIQTHMEFLQDPMFGQNAMLAPRLLPAALEHINQHLVLAYGRMMYDAATQANNGKPIDKFMSYKDPETRAEFDKLMATVATVVNQKSQQAFAQLLQPLQQLMQKMQASQPPQPMDPTQAAMADVQRQTQKDQADQQLKQAELAQQQQADAQDAQLKQLGIQQKAANDEAKLKQQQANANMQLAAEQERQMQENQRAAQRDEVDQAMNHEDNQTAMVIAAGRAIDKEEKVGNMTTGSGVTNPNP